MGEVAAGILSNASSFVVLVVALLYVAYAVRNDAAKTLSARVLRLETQLSAEIRRRFQLEGILRHNGIEVPAWDNYPDFPTDPATTRSTP